MKIATTILLSTVATSAAFSVQKPNIRLQRSDLSAVSRRDACLGVVAVLVGASPANAAADVDYARIQDLLKGTDAMSPYEVAPPGTRPKYLVEPTAEFKENEAKASEFKRIQLQGKKAFLDILEKLETDPNDESMLAKDLDDMRRLVKKNYGLPLGITKDELVKRVRRRKAKKFWPTQVEVAYQDLFAEITYQQSPNKEKDTENPL
jgi:hypothetical protein